MRTGKHFTEIRCTITSSEAKRPIFPKIALNDRYLRYRASACYACSARYCFSKSVCLSVCLSVCPSHSGIVFKRMRLSSKYFPPCDNLVFCALRPLLNFNGNSSGFVKYTGWKKLPFSTEITLYLGNSTRLVHDYKSLMESRSVLFQ